jgi:hypothetical protein
MLHEDQNTLMNTAVSGVTTGFMGTIITDVLVVTMVTILANVINGPLLCLC